MPSLGAAALRQQTLAWGNADGKKEPQSGRPLCRCSHRGSWRFSSVTAARRADRPGRCDRGSQRVATFRHCGCDSRL